MRKGEEVFGTRMSTQGPLFCFGLAYKVESWDRYILQNDGYVPLADVLFPLPCNVPLVVQKDVGVAKPNVIGRI